jgi:hypothetical protein
VIRERWRSRHERQRQRAAAASSAETFQAIAEEWIAARAGEWSPTYREAVHSALAANLYPQIGAHQIRSITVPVMREALLLMERRGALAALARSGCGRPRCSGTPSRRGGRQRPGGAAPGHVQGPQGPELRGGDEGPEFGELIARIRAYDGSVVTRHALM